MSASQSEKIVRQEVVSLVDMVFICCCCFLLVVQYARNGQTCDIAAQSSCSCSCSCSDSFVFLCSLLRFYINIPLSMCMCAKDFAKASKSLVISSFSHFLRTFFIRFCDRFFRSSFFHFSVGSALIRR